MGQIVKTAAGTFQVTVNNIHGERIRKTFKLKKDALAFVSSIENPKHQKLLEVNNLKKRRVTFDTAITDFLETKSNLAPKTVTKYNFTMKQFGLYLEAVKVTYLDEFNSDHATLLQTQLKKESTDSKGNKSSASPKTINGFMAMVKSLFNDEVGKEHLTRNPLGYIKSLKEARPQPEYYTVKEINDFFNVDMKKAYRNAFTGLLFTGVRFGELANITWEDIDMERKLVLVRPKENHKLKTSSAERSIPMNDKLFNLLQEMSLNKQSDTYPFCSVEGKQLKERKLLEVCKRIGAKAGITSRLYLHRFRSTMATMLVQRRSPIEYVQKLLGHSSILQTMVYAHVETEELHSEVNLLNDIIVDEVDPVENTEGKVFNLNTKAA